MSFVYWLSDGVGAHVNKGGPAGDVPIPTIMLRWIRANGSPSLIVNGGDVYRDGKTEDFLEFFDQMDNDVTLICEPAGNHDWMDVADLPATGRIPHGYDTFWRGHPESKQPVDATKKGGARYEHFIDLDGWRLMFLDTGDYDPNPWPAGDQNRVTWLENSLNPGRANIVFAHHSRLSRGSHGDNDDLDVLWKTLFDASGPRVAFMIGGHDHNVSVYGPRSKDNPAGPSVTFDKGIHVIVNGAGGKGHYSQHSILTSGARPDLFADDERFFLTRINIIDATSVDVELLDFGTQAVSAPVAIPQALVKIRL
jgi:Calcineurin-like phosphoesterase